MCGIYIMDISVLKALFNTALIVAPILALPFIWCALRIFVKRLSLYFKLTSVCRKNDLNLIPTHTFWQFGGRKGGTCDFYIEAPDIVYSVKLIPMRSYHTELHFTDDGKYYIRSSVVLARGNADVDSKRKTLTDYDFRYDFRSEWHMKRFSPVLLVNPICREIKYVSRNRSKILGAGEMVNGMYIYSLSRFLSELEAAR